MQEPLPFNNNALFWMGFKIDVWCLIWDTECTSKCNAVWSQTYNANLDVWVTIILHFLYYRCPKILYPIVHDIISPNGNGLRNCIIIPMNTNMCNLKMSGEQTLKVLRNQSYGQIKFGNQNLKNTKVWKLRAHWKVCNQGWPMQIWNNQG